MMLGLKVGVLRSFVTKIVGNNYGTDTSVQPAIVEVRECSIRVCSFGHRTSQRLCFINTFTTNLSNEAS